MISENRIRVFQLASSEEAVQIVLPKTDLRRETITREQFSEQYGEQTVTFRQAARMLGVSTSTIWRWADQGLIRRVDDETCIEPGDQNGDRKAKSKKLLLADVLYQKEVAQLSMDIPAVSFRFSEEPMGRGTGKSTRVRRKVLSV